MSTHLEAAFTLDDWIGVPVDDPAGAAAGGPAVATASARKTYTGAVVGTSDVRLLTTWGEHGQAYVAQERLVGVVDGRAGSVVLQHGAVVGEGVDTGQWLLVVPHSGTGELTGLRGSGRVEHELLVLDYDVD